MQQIVAANAKELVLLPVKVYVFSLAKMDVEKIAVALVVILVIEDVPFNAAQPAN